MPSKSDQNTGTNSKRSFTVVDYRSRWRSAVSRSGDARMATELGLATLLVPVGSFVANIVFARTLGASGRGDLAAIIAALAVSEAVLTFGLADILARHIAKGSLPAGAQRTLAAGVLATAILPGLLLAFYCHSRHFMWPVAVIAGVVVPIATATAVARGVLNGRQEYRRLTVSWLLSGALRLLAPLILILIDTPNENLALILVLGWIVAPAVPIFAGRPFAGPFGSARDAWQILRESLGVWPAYLAWQVNARLDQLVLSLFVSAADLGRYAVCVGIAEVPTFLANGPRQVMLARVAKTHSFHGVPRMTQGILVVGLVTGVLAAFFSAPLLAAVFGPDFRSASLVLGILLAATGFDVGAGLLNSCLIAVGRGKSATINQMVSLSITAVVVPSVVSLGGGIAAAAAVRLVGSTCAYLLALLSSRRFSRSEAVVAGS